MPRYYRDGVEVGAPSATYADGSLRPGFRTTIAEGDYVGFDLAFMDAAAPTGRLMMFDAAQQVTDATSAHAVARARSQFDLRHAYLGDQAPKFTDAMAAQVAANGGRTPVGQGSTPALSHNCMSDEAARLRRSRYLP